MHVTWEPEGRLPPAIVQEFETGQKVDTVQNTALLYGTLNTTLVSSATVDMSPPTKKARTESGVVMEKNTGYYKQMPESSTLLSVYLNIESSLMIGLLYH